MPVRSFRIADLLDQVDEVNTSDPRKVDFPLLLSTSVDDDEEDSLDVTGNQPLIKSEEDDAGENRLEVITKQHTADLFRNQSIKQTFPHQAEGKTAKIIFKLL